MNTVHLNEMKVGQRGSVRSLSAQGAIGQRLLEMGITNGTPIEVIRFAPMGDPIDIKIRGYHLSLRLKEAEVIEVSLEN